MTLHRARFSVNESWREFTEAASMPSIQESSPVAKNPLYSCIFPNTVAVSTQTDYAVYLPPPSHKEL